MDGHHHLATKGFGVLGTAELRTNEQDPQPTRVDGHPPLTLEHQLTGAPREARKASGGQLILVTASGASRPGVLSGVGGRSRPYITPGVGDPWASFRSVD